LLFVSHILDINFLFLNILIEINLKILSLFINMNIKKRGCIILGLFILIIGIFTIYAEVIEERGWHSADEILITVNSYTMTLQEAINYDVFIKGANTSYTTKIPNPGHNAEEIWIFVKGNEMNLQDAILMTDGLCGKDFPSSSYSGNISLGQFANEIKISFGKSLQDAINSGELVSINGGWSKWSDWSDCSVECGGGTRIRTRTCTNPKPSCRGTNCVGGSSETQSCNTQSCSTTWTWQSFTYVSCYPSTCSGDPCDWSRVGKSCSPKGATYVCEGGGVNCHGNMGCSLYQSVCG
jgi:hypothetical protein